MIELTKHLAAFVGVFVATYAGTGLVLLLLMWLSLFDQPNERSSHTTPIPRGGGLAVVPVVLGAWAWVGHFMSAATPVAFTVIWCALALAAISWLEDWRGVPTIVRLLAQVAAVSVALFAMRDFGPFFGGFLSPNLDLFAVAVLWVWFINLYNFMDGIDGITGVETACLGLGVALVAALANLDGGFTMFGTTLAAAAFGFLWWNWQPARVFLGDVGSIPLGFLSGWLLLMLADQGQWAVALILPLYYLADATITLLRRIARRERFWRAHRQHFYQQATQWRMRHRDATLWILAANVVLIALALVAVKGWIWPALAGAFVAVAALLFHFGRRPAH